MFNMTGKDTNSLYSIMLSFVSFRGKLNVYELKETNCKYQNTSCILQIFHIARLPRLTNGNKFTATRMP